MPANASLAGGSKGFNKSLDYRSAGSEWRIRGLREGNSRKVEKRVLRYQNVRELVKPDMRCIVAVLVIAAGETIGQPYIAV